MKFFSTVSKGVAYEEAVINALQDISMFLTRWGAGAHDQGIDLRVRSSTTRAQLYTFHVEMS
jgi:hypothetical protein